MKLHSLFAWAVAGVLAIAQPTAPRALAQSASEWPARTVRIVTPFPTSAGPEVVVRVLAEKLSKSWSRPVIVENRPGANGFLAITAFKQGDRNGYDLIHLDNVHLTAYPHLFRKLPYDTRADFDILLPLFRASFFFVVPTHSAYKSVADLIADARAKPGRLNYGSWSIGNPVHLASQLFESLTGTQMQHVVYKETSQLYSDVASSELAFALGTYGTTQALHKAGRLRYLAVIGAKRLPAYPDVPTVRESGGPAELEAIGWTMLAAPRGAPPAVTEKIRTDLEKALAEPDIAQRYATFGYESFQGTSEQLDAHIASESTRLADVGKRAKISLDGRERRTRGGDRAKRLSHQPAAFVAAHRLSSQLWPLTAGLRGHRRRGECTTRFLPYRDLSVRLRRRALFSTALYASGAFRLRPQGAPDRLYARDDLGQHRGAQ